MMKNEKFGAEEIFLAPQTTPSPDFAAKNSQPTDEMTDKDLSVQVENKPKKAVRVGEMLDLREGNRKVFRMSDNTQQAVFYPETVHVLDRDTNLFHDAERTLVEEEDGKHFVSGKNPFKAGFSREEENDELFFIESGTHRITVSAEKNSKQRNKGVKPKVYKQTIHGVEKKDALVFSGVQPGSDYEYSVSGNGIKENIIVKDRAEVYRYPFIIHTENVTAEFDGAHQRMAFISNETGEEIFFIPAPFMTDADGAVSAAVSYQVKNTANGDVIFNVVADSGWMNAEERAFPVVIDPQIQLSANAAMTTYSWDNGNLYASSLHTVGTGGTGNAKRMYMTLKIPALACNPRIKKAELVFVQNNRISTGNKSPNFGLYRVDDPLCIGSCTPAHDTDLIDFAKMQSGNGITYSFDVTSLVDQVNKGELSTQNLVMKMLDEENTDNHCVTLYGGTSGTDHAPQLIVTYEPSCAVNTSYRTHTHELGRFGQGSIDLQCGNLMFESEDFAWSGNRMPVTVKHLYNSALSAYQYTANGAVQLPAADFSAMKIGNGFKLNVMQSMMPATFQHDGELYVGYVYIGENGEQIHFKESDRRVCCTSHSHCYYLYEDVNGGDMLYDPERHTLKQGEETYWFDENGKLVKITDAAGNHMDITYTSDKITFVTDGAGRDFRFAYSGDFLTSVTAPDDTSVCYAYSDDLLSSITYPDGRKAVIEYTADKPSCVTLLDAHQNSVYKAAYTFNGDRLVRVTEYGGDETVGNCSEYDYSAASGRTVVQTTEQADSDEGETSDHVIKTVYTFDDEGNVVSEYLYTQDIGHVGTDGEQSGIHPHSGDGGAGVVSNINNLLIGHNFEDLTAWTSMPGNSEDLYVRDYAYEPYTKFGKTVLRMQSYQAECRNNGVYQITDTLPAGQYTFSVYLRVLSAFGGTDAGAFIRVCDAAGNVVGVSERLTQYDTEYTRLILPFELANAQSVHLQILVNGTGTVYADAAQLENNPYANAYNMLENGNFERGTNGWEKTSGVSCSTDTRFNMSKSLMMVGSVDALRSVCQDVTVRTYRSTRETFTLSGWAKGYGLPDHERDGVTTPPTFRLRAVIHYADTYYKDNSTEEFTADFSPCTEEWQFASVHFSKSKYRTIRDIRVYCDYDYNSGTVYFDDIQLVRNSLETNLSASDFVVESTGVSDDTVSNERSDTAPAFNEAKDDYGNALTETTFTDGEFGTIYRSFGFTPQREGFENAGNDLIRETDARGHDTSYTVDEDTSRNEEVTDRCGNKTAYEYNASGKTSKVISKDADGTELANVSYAYDAFDNMTDIVRGDGMKYALAYNAFHNLESIGIEGKTEQLIRYTYKNGNGRLKQMTYANGHTMKATYNSIGQMVAERWFESEAQAADSTAIPTAHYKYVYDGEGNIVQSIDFTNRKCYNYEYEEDKIVRATESDILLSGEVVTSKVIVNTVRYFYDTEGRMTKKVISPANGSAQTVYYETNDDNTVVKFFAGDKTVTAHSKTDSFGRKVFDELQLGTGFVSRQFSYHAGAVTEEHKENAKLKSSATTQLVSRIVLSNGTTLSYGYDAEERITSVAESYEVDGVPATNTTLYTYDALGQLLTETVNGAVVNAMEYDRYGNIRSKNGVTYTYGDSVWKDLLTGVGAQTIAYDAQGNPVNYLGHTLAWEKGRQLKSFDGHTYTYNANGIRTSKTVNGVLHTYTLDGTKILRETWGENSLIPLYDNEDSVCGILYNDEPYYFMKNLQGDVIAIVNRDAQTVARYAYDAWGAPAVVQDSTACGIASINPYRYRGYYYDQEIGLYYLQSRYYDAVVGRFVCGDSTEYIYHDGQNIGTNIFAYCENDPVNNSDPNGTISLLACIIIGVIVGAAVGAIASKMIYGKVNGWWVLGGAVVGGVLGYFGGAFFGASGIKAGTLASKISMSRVRWVGKIGEKLSRLPKNTKHIESLSKTAKYRIPDYLDKVNKIIGDVKYVKKLSYTSQLRDFMLYAEKYGYTYVIKIRKTTQFSSALKSLVDAGKIILLYF